MSILDKANEYIGHPREVDEGYEVSMRRDAYAQGYQDAIEKAAEWLYVYYPTLERSKSAEDAWDKFKKAMEEQL